MKKILIIQPIHQEGIKLLQSNSEYEFEVVENIEFYVLLQMNFYTKKSDEFV